MIAGISDAYQAENLLSGAIVDYTFKRRQSRGGRDLSTRRFYPREAYQFMDMATYDQFFLTKSVIGDMAMYLVEGTEVSILNWNGHPINLEIPVKVTLTVTEAPPGIKGDTASGGDKVVTLETGLTVTTPLFIKTGDRIIVNTERGTYVSRA
jgi:elongation factor P